jgi:hypothetical protein
MLRLVTSIFLTGGGAAFLAVAIGKFTCGNLAMVLRGGSVILPMWGSDDDRKMSADQGRPWSRT